MSQCHAPIPAVDDDLGLFARGAVSLEPGSARVSQRQASILHSRIAGSSELTSYGITDL
jgi:hypothetical protein